uniref:Uncharacterized protein n=1 Tax=Hyaloperonospora arabidopsidis (strain Emoy2) TaxID=559515 RepID=M4C5H7_HYAAE
MGYGGVRPCQNAVTGINQQDLSKTVKSGEYGSKQPKCKVTATGSTSHTGRSCVSLGPAMSTPRSDYHRGYHLREGSWACSIAWYS